MTNTFKIDLDVLKIVKSRVRVSDPVNYDFDEIMRAVRFVGQKLMPSDSAFSLPPERHEFYTQLIYYFFNDPKFNGNLGKGLLIRGGRGTGKTMAINVFRTLCFNGIIPQKKAYALANCDEIVNNYEVRGASSFQNYFRDNWCFDDLGHESRYAMFFGTPRNVMKDILTRRYRDFVEYGLLTFVTSNFDFELIEKEYGKRVEDRFYEMFNDMILDGKSLR